METLTSPDYFDDGYGKNANPDALLPNEFTITIVF
jgi:hypothetical protein